MTVKEKNIIFFFFFTFTFVFFVNNSYSQNNLNVKASLNNLFRYGSGKETLNGIENKKEYFENVGDARLQVNDIIFGMRYEISDPIEYGSDFKGIKKRNIEYTGSDLLNIRAGDFWEVIGRGLSLNTFEQRQLFFDTGIDGVRVIFKKNFGNKNPIKIKSEILGGNIEYSDFLQPDRIEIYKVRDFNFEITPLKFLSIGTNYVYSTGSIPSGNVVTQIKAYIPEFFTSINLPNFQLYSSYAHKHTNTDANTLYPFNLSASGDAFYSSISYTKPGLGITFEYKNYRYDLTTPDNQSTERPTKMLPFQNPPTAVKEHTSTLTSRTPHVVDFNDEVGGQLEIMWTPKVNLFFVLNGGVASRHYSFSDIDTGSRIIFKANERKYNFIPSLNDAFSPYWEVSLESEYYISDKIFFKSGLFHQSGVLYNDIYPNSSDKKRLTTIPLEMRYTVKKDYTLKFIFENQWAFYSLRTSDNQNFTNQFAAISISKSPDFSFTLSSEFTNDNLEPTGKKNWVEAETSYNLNSSNVLIVSYGSERGGLKCTSGICRYVNPFNGFRLTIQSKF
ncbi:MAG: DUF6029 family protein [Ignavibacteria bacterium]|jgi:hypothetical protein